MVCLAQACLKLRFTYGIQSCHKNNLSSICIYCHHRGIENGVKHAYLVEEDSKKPLEKQTNKIFKA